MSAGDWKDLYKAVCDGNLSLVRYHVDAGVNLNHAHPEFFSTPLVAAIRERQVAVALFLLDHGADPRLCSEMDDLTPLQAARRFGVGEVEARLKADGVVPEAAWRRWWPFARTVRVPSASRPAPP